MPFLLIWLCFGIAAAIVASNKNRSGFGWFLLGILLGPFGLIFALVVAKIERPPDPYTPLPALTADQFIDQQTKLCPHCAETIKLAAKKCRFCLETFDPDQVARDLAAHREKIRLPVNAQLCPKCGSLLADPWCPRCRRLVL